MNANPDFTPRTEEEREKVLKLRKDKKLSFAKIEARTGVSRETIRKWCNFYLKENDNKVNRKVKVVSKTRNKPVPTHRSSRDYDFLKYSRIVYKWAVANSGLSRGEVDLLLYLYPEGAFSYSKFHKFHKVLSMFQNKTLQKLLDESWIKVWREKTSKQTKLYVLTNKAKTMCDNMHKYLLGEKEIPMDNRNKLVTDKSTRINDYYMAMINQMSKR